MYKVFNMGHRMEIYIDPKHLDSIIEICKEFDVDESFYDLFTEWYTDLCLESDEGYSLINDKSLIDDWWDQELCKSGETTPFIS